MTPSAGEATDCFMNSTVSTQPHLADYISIDMAMMASIDRDGIVPEFSALTRRAAITEEACRGVRVKVSHLTCVSCLASQAAQSLLGPRHHMPQSVPHVDRVYAVMETTRRYGQYVPKFDTFVACYQSLQ